MPSRRVLAVAAVVLVLGAAQILYEEVLVFLETTGSLPPWVLDSPFVMVAIPFAIAVTLVVVLLGAAVLDADTLR